MALRLRKCLRWGCALSPRKRWVFQEGAQVPGVSRMTEVMIKEQMTRMTSSAIAIPFQFLCGGLLPTSSWEQPRKDRNPVSNMRKWIPSQINIHGPRQTARCRRRHLTALSSASNFLWLSTSGAASALGQGKIPAPKNPVLCCVDSFVPTQRPPPSDK